MSDVSPDFHYCKKDDRIIKRLLKYSETPQAIVEFEKECKRLSDYAYWFVLGTLWVSYTGFSDLKLWRRLFESDRPQRATGLMKPSELDVLARLPNVLSVYRAHRTDEQDWLAYTIDPKISARFAIERGVSDFIEYRMDKTSALAYFHRRGECELLTLRKDAVQFVRRWDYRENLGGWTPLL